MHPPSTTAATCAPHRDAITTALDHILACPFATAEEGGSPSPSTSPPSPPHLAPSASHLPRARPGAAT
eukprot:4516133-Prymnesium_polylepis.1